MSVVLITSSVYVCVFVYVPFISFGFGIGSYQKILETVKPYFCDLSFYLYIFAS